MTTYEEISSDAAAHHEFFTQRARFNLVCYKEHLRNEGKQSGNTRLTKSGFRSDMKHRRDQTFLEGK